MVKKATLFTCEQCDTQYETLQEAKNCEHRCNLKASRQVKKRQEEDAALSKPRLQAKTLAELIEMINDVLDCDLRFSRCYRSYGSDTELSFELSWKDCTKNPFSTDSFDRFVGMRLFNRFGIQCYSASSNSAQAYIKLNDFPEIKKTFDDFNSKREHDSKLAQELEVKYAELAFNDETYVSLYKQFCSVRIQLARYIDDINEQMQEEYKEKRLQEHDLSNTFRMYVSEIKPNNIELEP
jgi:hypothetical protein